VEFLLSKVEVKMLRRWEKVAPRFRTKRTSVAFKDIAFREVYGELIRQVIRKHLPQKCLVLKTDLWNEGIEVHRNLAAYVNDPSKKCRLIAIDVCRYVCESAKHMNPDLEIVRATLLAFPFRRKFDLIIDPSTVDHMPERLREVWVSAESQALKSGGVLLISFDCRMNLFTELYHRLLTRRVYPEWTLAPAQVRAQLASRHLTVIREHAVFVAGLFLGTHRPWFPFSPLLNNRGMFSFIKRVELSKRSHMLSFLAPQYVIIARSHSS
jgi:hypothetical protein